MSYSPVGDTVALTNLAYTLYTKVYAVAKNAPEEFGKLSQELNIYKVVLFRIRDQVRRDADSEYGKPVKDVLERCFQTLRGVRDLTAKYENLGWSDRGVWFKRLQWAKDQNAIQDFRTRFSNDQQLLQFILTADGSTQEWLRLAIWWLVKSRIIGRLLAQNGAQRRRTDASVHDYNWESTISSVQAYADLLKCSWILEEIILGASSEMGLASKNIRRLVKDLARSLDRDLIRRRDNSPEFPAFEDELLLKQNLSLIESFEQTIEAKENVPNAMDDLADAHRWLEVDDDNAGLPHERVKFRTFVNAQIGSKDYRSKSSSAPYMLLLWTTVDESDLLVSLCNQQGTVNLSRTLLRSDLEAYEKVNETTPFVIEFPSQEAEVMFLTSQDILDFSELPRQHFQAMKQREPHAGELAIFQAPLSAYSETSPSRQVREQHTPSMAASKTSSCGLRLYETVSDKYWRITRRLVISSAPDSADPHCISHWLPLDCVRVAVEDAKATVSWSDCGKLQEFGDGKFGVHYSYRYKPEEPNRKIHLEFRNALDAQNLEQCLLYPTEMPPQLSTKLDIPYAFQNNRTYRLFDVDEPNKGYHAIASTMKSPQGPHMTQLHYIYRDYDWIIKSKPDT
ncbi:hypothetical protein P7C71_g4350, partial [Lecanoromycetidae sp. Uapishka_2]